MASLGRPTPQAPTTRPPGERPRYRDRDEGRFRHPLENRYVEEHRAFGLPLIPANEASQLRNLWHESFGRQAPLHVEIGSGNGFFLSGMAGLRPDWDWVGIEIRYKRTVMCATKIKGAGVQNARIVRYHAAFLDDLFDASTIDGLYVNHPDPWPKERHEGNRLISRWFLEDVVDLLKPGAHLRMKTDHLPNIERLIAMLDHDGELNDAPRLPLEIRARAYDVTRDPAPWPEDVETNYQRKFRLRGLPVHAIEVVRTDAPAPERTTGR